MKNTSLLVSVSPHITHKGSVPNIMWKVCFALMPALGGSIYFFGIRSLFVTLACVLSSVFFEYVVLKMRHREIVLDDGSAVLTGLLLAFNLPVSIPLWMAVLGSFVAIVVTKHAFGGLGYNILNPALVGRAFLLAAYPVDMTTWWKPRMDGVTGATPLGIIKEHLPDVLPDKMDMFIGNIGGSLGETSAMLLLVGAVYLLISRVITLYIPLSYIGTVALITWAFGGDSGLFTGDFLFHILAGGLILGAFYMATDMVTSPMTHLGGICFGVGCGIIASLIRLWGGYPEGVSYSILIMNLTVPLIDRWTKPRLFGKRA